MPRPELEQGKLDKKRIQELVTKMQMSFSKARKASCNAIDSLYEWVDENDEEYKKNYDKLTEFVDSFVELYKYSKNEKEFSTISVNLISYNEIKKEDEIHNRTVPVYFNKVMDSLREDKNMSGIHKMLRNRLLESFGKPDGVNSEETELYNDLLNDITGRELQDTLNKAYDKKAPDNGMNDYKRMIKASIGNHTSKSYLFENSYAMYYSWKNDNDNDFKKNKIDSPYLGFYIKGAQSFMHLSNKAENAEKDKAAKNEQKGFIQSRYYKELKNIQDKEAELPAAQSKVGELEHELAYIESSGMLTFRENYIKSFNNTFAAGKYEEKFITFSQKLQADLVKLDGTNGTKKGERYNDMKNELTFLRDKNKDVLATLMNKGAKEFLDVANPVKAEKMIDDLKRVRDSVEAYIRYKHDAGTYKFFNFVGKKRYSAAQDIKTQLDGMISSLTDLNVTKGGHMDRDKNDAYYFADLVAETKRQMAECSNRLDEAKKAEEAITNSINTSKKHLEMYDSLIRKNGLGEIEKQLAADKYEKTQGFSYGETFKNAAIAIAFNFDMNLKNNYYYNEAYEEFLKSVTKAGNVDKLGFDSKVVENCMSDKITDANMDYVKDMVVSVTIMNMISRNGGDSVFGKTLNTCKDLRMDYKLLKEEVLNNKNVKEELDKMTYGDLYGFIKNEGRISMLSDKAFQNVTEKMISKAENIAGQKMKKEQPVAKNEIKKEVKAEVNKGMGAVH